MTLPDLSGASDIAATRRVLSALFEKAGLDSPALDARLLIGHALALDHVALAASPGRAISPGERDAIAQFAARRLTGEPVARIIGAKEFWGLPFALSKATLVPRPDTETVVEAALAAIASRRTEALRIADLGTGTGAILLALLHELRDATGVGTDLDPDALETAQQNAQALGLASRAQFMRADFGNGLQPAFDLVVSNPPYIASHEIVRLAPDVRDHDPRLALDGGRDGFDAYRTIAVQAPALLKADGALIVEIGSGQAAEVAAILEAAGLTLTATRADLAGIARALTFRRDDVTRA